MGILYESIITNKNYVPEQIKLTAALVNSAESKQKPKTEGVNEDERRN